MYRFQHPEYLWLLAAVPLVVLLFAGMLVWRGSLLRRLGAASLINAQFLGRIPGRTALKAALLALSLAIAIIGAANLQGGGHPQSVQRKGVDVVIALDVSRSMLAQDLSPNRLTRARQFIERLLDKLHNDRVGLVLFAGRAYLQVPLTVDYSSMRLMLQNVRPDLVPTQGTVIGDAIELAMKSFSQKERKYKSLIVISDGEDHDEKAASKAAEAAETGVTIYTVGVGSPQGAPIYDEDTKEQKLDESGQPVITRLNEEELQSLARRGSGSYTLLRNADDAAANIATAIDDSEGRSMGAVDYTDYVSYFQWFLLPALLLLIAVWAIPGAKPFRKWNTV